MLPNCSISRCRPSGRCRERRGCCPEASPIQTEDLPTLSGPTPKRSFAAAMCGLLLHRVDRRDLRGDELHHVLVPGDDDDRAIPRLRLPGGRSFR